MVECEPLSIRNFISSNGSTSATSCTPTASKAGRPAGKRSSITHWLKGSVMIGQASSRPVRSRTSWRSASVVAGTMRSTMVEGKATVSATWRPSPGSRSAAKRVTMRAVVRPLAGRLSQLITVNGGMPDARRLARASTMSPGALTGSCGWARSCTMSGWFGSISPVAGSWQ